MQIAKDLKPVYTAASESEALDRFAEFSGKWEKRYPAIIRLWENAWAEFVPFLAGNWIGLPHLVIPVVRWVAASGQGCPCQAGSGIQGSPWAAWVRASRAPMPWRAAVAR